MWLHKAEWPWGLQFNFFIYLFTTLDEANVCAFFIEP